MCVCAATTNLPSVSEIFFFSFAKQLKKNCTDYLGLETKVGINTKEHGLQKGKILI